MIRRESASWASHSLEAEQSVLGALLVDNDALSRVAGVIGAESFWHRPHGALFRVISGLIQAGQPADMITVFAALEDAGRADEVGGMPYLNQLTESVVSATHARHYAQIVADKAMRRTLLAAADDLPELVRGATSADEALDQAQALLGAVKRLKAGVEPRAIGDLVAARVDHWAAIEQGDVTPGIPCGLANIDDAVGCLRPGQVIVLAARPSVGKTSLATQILLHVGRQGHPALMLSQEMTAAELTDRVAANLGSIRLRRLRSGGLDGSDWSRVAEVADRARTLPVFVDDQPALTLLDIRAKARQVQRRGGGLALMVIDYLQLCSSAGGAGERRHHQIEQISRGIKALAKELQVCVLVLSQLNRAGAEEEPELHHLKESGAIEEDADAVMMLHPIGVEPEGTTVVLGKLAKNRSGRRGRIALAFDGVTQQWTPLPAERVARGGHA